MKKILILSLLVFSGCQDTNSNSYDKDKYSEVGESYEDFSKRISEHLTNPAKVKEYAPYLKQLGFK